MANSSSIIRVSIIGDADKLTGALDKAEGKISGIAKKLAVGFVALRAGGELVDFLGDSVQEADRLEDATSRLNIQLGKLADPLIAGAGDDYFLKLGLSPQDVLEMEARFADLGTAIGLSDTNLSDLADEVAATAAAISLLEDKSPDEILDLIAKAAGGSAKAAKELGVRLGENLTPAEQLTNIMTQLKPKLDEATTGTGDLEQKQGELQARVEKLQGILGGPLSDAMATVLDLIIAQAEALPGAIEGFRMLWKQVELGGDAFDGITDSINNAWKALNNFQNLLEGTGGGGAGGEFSVTNAQKAWENRNQGTP